MNEEQLNQTEEFEDMLDEIIEETERMGIRISAANAASAAVSAVKPVLQEMAYDERRNACADIARNLKDAGLISYIRISIGLPENREKDDPKELGRRIMAERNANYR